MWKFQKFEKKAKIIKPFVLVNYVSYVDVITLENKNRFIIIIIYIYT